MSYQDDRRLEQEVRAMAKKHDLPFTFCNQLLFHELRSGVSVPDGLEWLEKTLPKFTGRVR